MNDNALHRNEIAHPAGAFAAAILRAIDAGLRVLQGWRHRIMAPEENEGVERERGRAEIPVVAVATEGAHHKTLLHRALIVLMCLLLGGVAGMLISHRGFSHTLDARDRLIESMQEEIAQAQKEEAHNINAKAKYQNELSEYRKNLREARQEVEDYKGQVDDLKAKVATLKQIASPAVRDTRLALAGAAKARTPKKTGTCVTGTANLTGNLSDCIEKFNRP